MNNHTHGAWSVRDRGYSLQIICARTKRLSFRLADLHWWSGKQNLPSKAEAVANAKLMAAAPDLLEALEAVLMCPSIHDVYGEDKDEETHAAERLARAAIKKARGQL